MITRPEWRAIIAAIRDNKSPDEIVEGRVIDRREDQQTVFLSEFGSEPIPMVALNFEFTTYVDVGGQKERRTVNVRPSLPEIGDLVLVARLGGSRHAPRCIGIVREMEAWNQPSLSEVV